MKKCKKCDTVKEDDAFWLSSGKLYSTCKDCKNIYSRERYKGKNLLLKKAKERAKKYKIPFDISTEDIIIPDICPILGIPLIAGEKIVCDTSPTLDRIKPELGYVKGNIQVLSKRANTLKSNATIEELEKVLEHLRNIV